MEQITKERSWRSLTVSDRDGNIFQSLSTDREKKKRKQWRIFRLMKTDQLDVQQWHVTLQMPCSLTCLLRETISRSMARSIWMPWVPAAMAARSSWLMCMPRGGRRLCLPPKGAPRFDGPQVGLNAPVRLSKHQSTN